MSASSEAFVRDLFAMVRERRSFGQHPLWKKIADGKVPRDKMKIFAAQFFLQVREFPRAISALHSRCYDSVQRLKLAESLYEEETGQLSGSAPHPELFIRLGTGLGMKREELTEAKPLPSTAALIDWFELSTKDRSFDEGIAAINVAAEGQVPGNFESFARALQKHYNLNTEQVSFFDVHELADRDHSDVGDHVLSHSEMTEQEKVKVRGAAERSVELWWQFFDGMERAIGV
ncbi:MAG TPA: iron-containing redox enzyme family protein [Candidatus Binataceae bacterium]|nr:iron-containing redox enzyme family protein [Candidatus Binataceae bacterium]